jgi:hypothetical protein
MSNADRIAVANAYPGRAWKDKVKKMSEQQVTAVYLRLKHQGVIR